MDSHPFLTSSVALSITASYLLLVCMKNAYAYFA
jgi:hypothetical protein